MAEHSVSNVRTATHPGIGSRAPGAAVEISKVLRNTYLLLGMTLAFSAVVAGVSMALNLPHPGPIVWLVGFFALLFVVHKTANSHWGLPPTPG